MVKFLFFRFIFIFSSYYLDGYTVIFSLSNYEREVDKLEKKTLHVNP